MVLLATGTGMHELPNMHHIKGTCRNAIILNRVRTHRLDSRLLMSDENSPNAMSGQKRPGALQLGPRKKP